jgi:hypothetical protein
MAEVPMSVSLRWILNQVTGAKQVFRCADLAAERAQDDTDARAIAVVLDEGLCRLLDIEQDLRRLLGDESEEDDNG